MKTDFLNGKPIKNIIIFALPIMASSFLQYAHNMVDNIIVGRYVSTNALAGVGNVGAINSLIIGTAFGLTAGFTIPVAQHFGSADKNKMNHFAGNSISLAFLIGIFFVIFAHIVSNPILKLIGTPSDIMDLSSSYINIIYYGIPLSLLYNVFISISRAVGDSKKPLYFLFISVICNLVLDILFVAKFSWGVEGAALATVISQLLSTVAAGIYIFKYNHILNIKKSDLCLEKKTVLYQLKLGVPMSLQFTITSIGSMALQSAVNSFGSNAVAAITAASKAENITNIPMSNIAVSTATFVAQNYGAKKYERIYTTVKKVFIIDILVSVLCSIILITCGEPIVKLFMTDYNPQIMEYAKEYLFAISSCYVLVSILFVMRNTLQGLGFTYSNAIAGAGELIGRIAVAYLLTPIWGFQAVCFAGPVAWFIADIPLVIIYLKKKKYFKELSLK